MPEKSVNEVARPVRELYEKGMAALERNNLDYALTFFEKVLETEPGFYKCREALRATQFKRAGSGGGFFKKMIGTASNSPQVARAQFTLRNNPIEALRILEQILNQDPNNQAAHRIVSEAALAADFPRTAVLSLEIIHRDHPRDRDTALKLTAALTRTGQIDKADRVLSDLAQLHPDDPEIVQALKDLSANRTLQEGGYDALAGGEGSYRDVLRDEKQAVQLEQEQRQVKTGDVSDQLLAEYEERLAGEPLNPKLLRACGDLHADRKEFDRALDYYRRLIEAQGGTDPTLEKALIDLKVKQIDHAISLLDPAAADHAERRQQLERERLEIQLEEIKRRVSHHPNDLQYRFELGVLLFQAGKLTEAIQEFQKATNNPHRRIQAMSHLAQCFSRRKMFDLAARRLEEAIREKQIFDDEKKELIYLLGCTLEKMGKAQDALEQFKLIYEVDIGYRDVAARVDAYYAGQEG